MAGNNKKYGLGRGLDALFGDENNVIKWDEVDNPKVEKIVENAVFKAPKSEIDINKIKPCRFQPRRSFDAEAMKSLSDSIRDKGVLQPLLLREVEGGYEIIAGERRWRAAQMAGLKTVPAVIKNLTDRETLEIALIENLQRENLSPIEEAEGLNSLIETYEYTQELVGKVVGKSRSYITNALRLLTLPAEVQQALNDGKITVGHARALVGCENAVDILSQIMRKNLSVRETENITNAQKDTYGRQSGKKFPRQVDVDLERIMQDLQQKLQLKVKISSGKSGKGSVTLHYNNPAELSVILDILEQR